MARIIVDEKVCKGCSMCIHACPKKIIALAKDRLNAKGYHPAELTDEAACVGCAGMRAHAPGFGDHAWNAARGVQELLAEKVLMKGNEALAEAAIQAGCHHFFGYPITPQTELAAYMAKRMPKIGGTYLQAESEIAAVNMVLGAAAAGVRAVATHSSSPGISLKGEGISYMAGSDLPASSSTCSAAARASAASSPPSPTTGRPPTRLGHGDFQILVFAPSTVQEMVDLAYSDAFDKADEYRMPAMILADGMLGQMMEPVELPGARRQIRLCLKSPGLRCGHQNKRAHITSSTPFTCTPYDLERPG